MRKLVLAAARVVSMALTAETVAIYGLTAAFLAHDWRLFVPAWVVSLIAFALAAPYPRRIGVS